MIIKETKEFLRTIGSGWNYNFDAEKLYLITTSPLETDDYFKVFDNYNQILTEEIYNATVHDIKNIELHKNNVNLTTALTELYEKNIL